MDSLSLERRMLLLRDQIERDPFPESRATLEECYRNCLSAYKTVSNRQEYLTVYVKNAEWFQQHQEHNKRSL